MTPLPPRDRALDELLRRQWPADFDADGAGGDACPDPEVLAAWSERALDPGQTLALETHLAGCRRCQAVTAALVRSAAPAVTAVAGNVEAAASHRMPRRAATRWVVPLSAAAAIAVYVLVRDAEPIRPASAPESAEVRGDAVMPVPPGAAGAAEAESPSPSPALPSPSSSRERAADASGTGRSASGSGRGLQADERVMAGRPAPPEATSGSAVPPVRPTPSDTGTEALTAFRAREEAAAATPAAAPPVPDVTAGDRPASSARVVGAIQSADAAVRWRLGGPGVVERSADGGVTWTRLETGMTEELTAGDAPSALVCWVVGRGGLVLRTLDAGTWQAVTRPTAADLVAVDAIDGVTAAVQTADGRRFRTTDGGTRWQLVR